MKAFTAVGSHFGVLPSTRPLLARRAWACRDRIEIRVGVRVQGQRPTTAESLLGTMQATSVAFAMKLLQVLLEAQQ